MSTTAAHVKNISIKPFVAQEEAACKRCHTVAELHCGSCRHQVLKRKNIVWNVKGISAFLNWVQWCHRTVMLDQWTAFNNLVPTLPTMQLSYWVTSLETVYQIICSFLWSPKRMYTTLFTHAVVLHNNCKHTLMCKIWMHCISLSVLISKDQEGKWDSTCHHYL